MNVGPYQQDPFPHLSGQSNLAVALTDWLQLEGGGDFSLTQEEENWAVGYGGLRFLLAHRDSEKPSFAFDLELGAGGGIGGMLDCNEDTEGEHGVPNIQVGASCDEVRLDDLRWSDRIAYGGYMGLGIGYHWTVVTMYFRFRFAASKATHIPIRYWTGLSGGVRLQPYPWLFFTIGGSILFYFNEYETSFGTAPELGVGFSF
ncbi:MAG: hypothetical protein JXR96_13880 [Deltaproteobacteria bacterium]|nr:hypothetical protein [Deltaproteobacteria bacterium]